MAEKSALYPRANWQDCLEFVKAVASFNLKAVAYTEICKKYGIANPSTKSFTSKISACKQFGLITTSNGNTVQLTDTCKRILYPIGESTLPIERACFGMPPLYNKLIAAYDGKALPSKSILANILMQEHKIQKNAKDSAAQIFIESAEQLSLIRGGVLCYSGDDETSSSFEMLSHTNNTNNSKENAHFVGQIATNSCVRTVPELSEANECDYITQSIPLSSGKIARFSIPVDASNDDLFLLRDMLEVILKRKFKLEI